MLKIIIFITLISAGKIMANDYYNLDGVDHNVEIINLELNNNQQTEIAKHSYGDGNSKKVLTLIHGLAENCGYLKPIIKHFISNTYFVECYELPGHGMSTGSKYDIDSFLSYELFYKKITQSINHSKFNVFISHSTGGVGITQSLLTNAMTPFNKVILLAPLVRINYWPFVKTAHFLLSNILTSIPRFHSKRGEGYNIARKNDPFVSETIPANWVNQNIEYEKKVSKINSISDEKFLIIYGSKDEVIDWEYSNIFYKRHFPKATIKVISKGSHHLYFDHEKIGHEFFSLITNFTSNEGSK